MRLPFAVQRSTRPRFTEAEIIALKALSNSVIECSPLPASLPDISAKDCGAEPINAPEREPRKGGVDQAHHACTSPNRGPADSCGFAGRSGASALLGASAAMRRRAIST